MNDRGAFVSCPVCAETAAAWANSPLTTRTAQVDEKSTLAAQAPEPQAGNVGALVVRIGFLGILYDYC